MFVELFKITFNYYEYEIICLKNFMEAFPINMLHLIMFGYISVNPPFNLYRCSHATIFVISGKQNINLIFSLNLFLELFFDFRVHRIEQLN